MSREHLPSKLAIATLVGGVLAYEALAPKEELITDEVRRVRKGKLGNFAVQAIVWTTALHLSGFHEATGTQHLDWLHRVSRLFKG